MRMALIWAYFWAQGAFLVTLASFATARFLASRETTTRFDETTHCEICGCGMTDAPDGWRCPECGHREDA